MARPRFGGWVSFTVHLAKKYNYPLYKIHTSTEIKKNGEPILRDFGYGVKYQNISIEDAIKLKKVLITAIDKGYYQYLSKFPRTISLVIHDPTEVKGPSTQPVIDRLKDFKIITIRETVKDHLKNTFNVRSDFKKHPFYKYTIGNNTGKIAVSISRIDFDKNTDIIIKANNELRKQNLNHRIVHIFGAKNDMYVFHKLQNSLKLNLDDYYCGKFEKSFEGTNQILKHAKYMIDLSAIKGDGGGTQYTFLEAIHQGAALILNKKWVDKTNSVFKDGYNCIAVSDEKELVKILKKWPDVSTIVKNSKKILQQHDKVTW